MMQHRMIDGHLAAPAPAPTGAAWWRRAVVPASVLMGAAAAFNVFARRGVRALENTLGGDDRTFVWRGHRIAYTVRGQGAPVLLVHGIHAAAWSHEWRGVAAALARRHTVYSIDLLGFGRSDRPAARYSAALYQALLADFVRQVIGAPTALVASSLTAAYAIALGARDPERFPALVLVAPTGLARLNQSRRTPASGLTRLTVETPVVGTALFNGLVTRASIRHYLEKSYADDKLVTEELVTAYWSAAHQKGAKHAPASFLAHQLDCDVRDAMRRLAQPTLVLWGERARMAPIEELRAFLTAKPDVEVAILETAGDVPHEERADEFTDVVTTFLDRAGHHEPREEAGTRRVA